MTRQPAECEEQAEKQRRFEEARQQFLNTWREAFSPGDRRAIAAAARQALQEDFPEGQR